MKRFLKLLSDELVSGMGYKPLSHFYYVRPRLLVHELQFSLSPGYFHYVVCVVQLAWGVSFIFILSFSLPWLWSMFTLSTSCCNTPPKVYSCFEGWPTLSSISLLAFVLLMFVLFPRFSSTGIASFVSLGGAFWSSFVSHPGCVWTKCTLPYSYPLATYDVVSCCCGYNWNSNLKMLLPAPLSEVPQLAPHWN